MLFFESSRSLQPARQVNAVVRRAEDLGDGAVEIRGSSGTVWVDALDPDPDDGTASGEVLLRVDVSSCGFVGCMFPWVRTQALSVFAGALDRMLASRTGEAVLPGGDTDFGLRVAWVERDLGPRLAAVGHITRFADAATDGGPHENVLRFGLDFPEAELAGVVAAARALAETHAEPTAEA